MSAPDFGRHEVSSIYVEASERFVVSLIVGYSPERDSVRSAQQAAHWALELTRDGGCDGTNWFVYDRATRQMYCFEQNLIEQEPPVCRTEGCEQDPDDGEGYDGYCGGCADQLERSGRWGI